MNILIVEDDESNRELFKQILTTECGGKCYTAEGVEESFLQLERNRFDIILLDYWLLDGFAGSIINTAREWYPDNPPEVILISAVRSAETIAEQLKVKYFFEKPFNVDHLKEAIDSICEKISKKKC